MHRGRDMFGAAVLIMAACASTSKSSPTVATSVATPAAVPGAPEIVRPDTQKWTGADARFMSGMIGHHAQAIVMARMAPSHGASSPILTLTGRVINAQQDEITVMQQWLRDRKQPVPDAAAMIEHAMHDMPGHALMPGMLTTDQMKQLDAARGADFDRVFLKFMIQHHEGAVAMVKDLMQTPGAMQEDAVFKLASDVNVDQTTEIARMQKMLVEILFGKDSND